MIREVWRRIRRDATVEPMTDEHDGIKRLWTATELAEHLGISRQAVNDRIRRGTLTPHYVAGHGSRELSLFDPLRVRLGRWRRST